MASLKFILTVRHLIMNETWKIKTFLNIIILLYLGFTNKGKGGCGSYLCYLAVGVRKIKFIYQFTSSSQTCGMRIETISMLWFWTRSIFILSSVRKLYMFKIQLQIHGLQNVFLLLLCTLSTVTMNVMSYCWLSNWQTSFTPWIHKYISNIDSLILYHVQQLCYHMENLSFIYQLSKCNELINAYNLIIIFPNFIS